MYAAAISSSSARFIARSPFLRTFLNADSGVRFIYGHANTLAETYAAANGYVFVPIQDD